MELVYIAGRYRAKDNAGIYDNIYNARKVAEAYWRAGYAVICPHQNSAFMGSESIPSERFLAGDLVMLQHCDLIVMIPGWQTSEGAIAEHAFAKQKGIPVTYWESEE